jgi:predicted Rossmann fold nucleotide-binding protein DprA/Smf involved in DNA uptake
VNSAGVADTNVGAGEPVDILLKALRSEPLHVDELCDASSLPLRLVVELLLTLTLQAVVVEGPAGFFRRVRH